MFVKIEMQSVKKLKYFKFIFKFLFCITCLSKGIIKGIDRQCMVVELRM